MSETEKWRQGYVGIGIIIPRSLYAAVALGLIKGEMLAEFDVERSFGDRVVAVAVFEPVGHRFTGMTMMMMMLLWLLTGMLESNVQLVNTSPLLLLNRGQEVDESINSIPQTDELSRIFIVRRTKIDINTDIIAMIGE